MNTNVNRYPILYALYVALYLVSSLVGFTFGLYFVIPWMYSTPEKTYQNRTVLQLHAISGFVGMLSGPVYFLLLLYYSRGVVYKVLRILFSIIYNVTQMVVFGTVTGLYPRSQISKKHGIAFTILFVGWALYLFITWIISWGIYIVSHHSRVSHRKESFRAISVNTEFRNVSMFLFGSYLIAMMQIDTQSILCIVSYLTLVILLGCNELFLYLLNHDPQDDASHEEIDVELPKDPEPKKPTPAKKSSKKVIRKASEYSYYSTESSEKKVSKKAPIKKKDKTAALSFFK